MFSNRPDGVLGRGDSDVQHIGRFHHAVPHYIPQDHVSLSGVPGHATHIPQQPISDRPLQQQSDQSIDAV